jgi:hypothetical protein
MVQPSRPTPMEICLLSDTVLIAILSHVDAGNARMLAPCRAVCRRMRDLADRATRRLVVRQLRDAPHTVRVVLPSYTDTVVCGITVDAAISGSIAGELWHNAGFALCAIQKYVHVLLLSAAHTLAYVRT